MRVLVTGGAGFIGRWVVSRLLDDGHDVWVVDDLSNGLRSNLGEFLDLKYFHGLVEGSVAEPAFLDGVFESPFDVCIHAAAQINVQESLDDPEKSFLTNVVGTYHTLRFALRTNTKVVLIGTCMVYGVARSGGISETSPVKPASPYAGSKLAAENLALSFHRGFGLPVVVLRPFNTYGPYQKTNMEGGVVSVFINNSISGQKLRVFGDGTQTRDLLYVEDCADFIVRASFSGKAVGEIINASTGRDISINQLALMICTDPDRIEHVEHHHPQSEVPKLLGSYAKAERLLGWKPDTSLEEGIAKTREWVRCARA